MMVRPFHPDDLSQLEKLYREQGFAYDFPNLHDPLIHIKLVGEVDGKIVNAAFCKLVGEIYFLADRNAGTPRQKFDNFVVLHDAGCEAAYRQGGLTEIAAWVPPQIAKPFGRRLMRLGWQKPLWTCFSKELGR